MKKRLKEPFIPLARQETIRQKIMELLTGTTFSARDLSAEIGSSERDIYDHLEHIRKTLGKGGENFIIIPAACRKCNFIFRKRDKLSKPGRCPVCRSESIQEPLFSIK